MGIELRTAESVSHEIGLAAETRGCERSLLNPTIYLVDSDLSARRALESLVSSMGWQSKCFDSAEAFLNEPRVLRPSCLVLDFSLPRLSGLDLQGLIADRSEMPVIFLSANRDVSPAVKAMKAGAIECLPKPLNAKECLGAIGEALEHSFRALSRSAEIHTLISRMRSLTKRERQVFSLVAVGRLNKQIGAALGISEYTVKAHRGQVMRKMAARSVADLVNMTGKLQLLRGSDSLRRPRSEPVMPEWLRGPGVSCLR